MVEALVGTERTDGRESSDRQVPWNLHRIRLRVFCIGDRPDLDSLDILFYRGVCIAAFLPIQCGMMLTHLGVPQIARKNGICRIPLTNEFLRDHSCRSHPQSFLEASLVHFPFPTSCKMRTVAAKTFR